MLGRVDVSINADRWIREWHITSWNGSLLTEHRYHDVKVIKDYLFHCLSNFVYAGAVFNPLTLAINVSWEFIKKIESVPFWP